MPFGFPYLGTPNGVLKILHLLFGGISLILAGTSYVPYWTLDAFILTVAVCFGLSFVYLVLNVTIGDVHFTNSKANRIVSCVYHIAAGTFLIAAGIDLIGWSDYDADCGFKCPRIYNIGVAKILTFVNGTLYGIHGFLEVKDDDEDFHGESIPLISVQDGSQIQQPQAHCSKNNYRIHRNINAINF